ncbi:1,4-dihydroxy-2-naphthoate octaprenyltransferase [Planobacterium oryzisoli]|uniref:1,4-dihydroxy-2-naphthoate octaprenyltransferase n=1 Tax=Planobacterium oryzisoli TaxID=2771435 RepID=A0A931E7X2_9FLAO|nr:1,4-dihydroxy-2-naphthoate octaprenyltransferase [Planobacterium oryzisoli]MBF5027396.1 1,4-dihydroxy-2-naphthoate octaprenyltransferase [Planobacterium oryzisoli]
MSEWIKAARLRTLPLSLSGIIVGSFIARWRMSEAEGKWNIEVFVLALLVTLLYQVLSNYANDYGDALKGTDSLRSSSAEARSVASGKISSKSMRMAIVLVAVLSLIATLALLYVAFLQDGFHKGFTVLLVLGILSILAAVGYTLGRKPYGYMGLGDIMVFLFFGILSVCGSYYLFTREFHWDMLLPASAIGLFSAAVLNLNNMRDMESDRITGKKTLALRLGYRNAMIYQMVLLQLPHILLLVFLMLNGLHEKGQYYAFIVMVMLFPTAALRRRILQSKSREELDGFLKQIGIITFATSILLAAGLNMY